MPENRPLVYLACPYSHESLSVMELRFHAVNRVAAKLMGQGLLMFSPISHTHPIAVAGNLPKGFDFWEKYDRAVLSCCGRVIVLMVPGWETSTGVQAEIRISQAMGIPIEYMTQDF